MQPICIFDLDGTLVNSMPRYTAGMYKILDDEGIEYEPDLIKILTPLGYTKSAEYYVEHFGLTDSVETIVKKMEETLVYEYANNIKLKDGVEAYLKKRKSEGARLFVLTASPHIVTDICLKNNGIFDLFEKVWSVEDFGLSKSGTALFYRVAELLECKPEDIEFFDDNLTAVANCKAAGMITYGVRDGQSDEDLNKIREICDFFVEGFDLPIKREKVRVEIHPTPKKRVNYTIPIIVFAFLAAFGILGIALTADSLTPPVKMLTQTAYGDFDNESIYFLDEVVVVDAYAEFENTVTQETEEWNLLIFFYDQDGTGCYASMNVAKTSPLWDRCDGYIKNADAGVGDLTLIGYFSCTNLSGLESPLPRYYNETYELFNQELSGVKLEKHFVFDGATATEAKKIHHDEAVSDLSMFGCFAIFGLVSLTVTLWIRKKSSAQNADLSNEKITSMREA